MKRLAAILFFAILPAKAVAQAPCSIQQQIFPSLPATIVLTWNDDNPANLNVVDYRYIFNTDTEVIVPLTRPTPCTDCATASLTIRDVGLQTFNLIATNRSTSGAVQRSNPPTVCTFTAAIIIGAPASPSGIHSVARPLAVGDTVVVVPPDSHSLRATPNSTAPAIATVAPGAIGVITAGPTIDQSGATTQNFYQVDWQGSEPTSWIVATWLARQ